MARPNMRWRHLGMGILALVLAIFAAEWIRMKVDIGPFQPDWRLQRTAKQRPAALRRELAVLRSSNLGLIQAPEVVINEVCATGLVPFYDGRGQPNDWVELYNNTDHPIDLEGYSLTDTRRRPRRWVFPKTIIKPHQYLIVWLSGFDEKRRGELLKRGERHAPFQLASTGEFLALYNPRGAVEDYVSVLEVPYGKTFGRKRDGDGPFAAVTPTPLGRTFTKPPSINMPTGVHTEPFEISLSCDDPEAAIRYTLDSSDPTFASPVYEGPIRIADTTVVKARVFRKGMWPGAVTTRLYWMEKLPSIPLLSIVVDPKNLYTKKLGIIRNARKKGFPWERPAHVSFFEDGKLAFEGPCGIRINGRNTRQWKKKSFKLFFRERYGVKKCDYDFIDSNSGLPFRRIIVKAAADLASHEETRRGVRDTSMISSPLGYDMMRACGVRAPRTRHIIVALNGKIHGLCYLAEAIDDHYLERYYGHSNFDLIKVSSGMPLVLGSMHRYNAMHSRTKRVLSETRDNPRRAHRQLNRIFDLDSLTRWVIVSVFTQVRDHKQGLYAFNERSADQRWFMITWDMDHAFRHSDKYGKRMKTWEFNKLRELKMVKSDLRGRITRRLLGDPEYEKYYAYMLQDLVNHRLRSDQWLPVLEERAKIIMDNVEYEARGDANRDVKYPEDLAHEKRFGLMIEGVREFLRHRPDYLLGQTARYFEWPEPQRIGLEVEGEGKVAINGYAEEDGFSGLFYIDSGLSCVPEPAEGFRFSHWELAGETSDRHKLKFEVKTNALIKAVFVPEGKELAARVR